jgi:tetratricopeptide (TPR) repeat protein
MLREHRPTLASVLAILAAATAFAASLPALLAELPLPDPDSAAGLLRRGRYEEAAAKFREEIAARTDDDRPVRGLAEALAALGRYCEALAALEASPLFVKSARLQAMAGRVLQRTGKLRPAEGALRKALELDSRHVEALNRLGEVLYASGRRKDAEVVWGRVIDVYQAMSSEEAESLPAEDFVEMGLALVHLNRHEEANEVMFDQAQDQDAENPALLLESGRTLQEKYNFPDARSCYRDLFKVNSAHPDARVALAENYLIDFQVGTERYELAEKQIEQALEVNPNHDGAYAARGSLWLSDGNLPRARGDFEKALELNPANFRALGLLAACQFLEGDAEGFRRTEERVAAINQQCAEFYHTVAQAIESRFRYLDAARMAEKALSIDAEYWPANHTLGINLLRIGDEERARHYLKKSFAKDPYNVWVYNTREVLRHMDKNHAVLRQGAFVFKLPKGDYEILKTYLVPLLEEAYAKLSEHYRVELVPPVFIEVFSDHPMFSARIVGLAGFPASGACFGNLVALTTPKALPQNWGAVAWHEFAHVITLHKTHHRVPRWLTEGLSVFEEGRDHPQWARVFQREIAEAYASGRLLGIAELDFGFSKPKYPMQVLMSYFQGCMIVKYVTKTLGFDKVLAVLDGYGANKPTAAIFQEVFGQTLEEFDTGFFAYLAEWVESQGYVPELGEEVIEKLQLETEENPKDVRKLVDLAWAYHSNGMDVDVPITAAKALEVEPEYGDAHAVLGLYHLSKKKTQRAKEHLEKARAAGTRFAYRVHEALGSLALKDGDKEKAVELFEKAKEISPIAGAGYPPGKNLYYRLADLYNDLGKEDLAVERLEELRNFAVEDPKCRIQLADHYLEAGSEEAAAKAAAALEEVIYINPFDRGVHEKLARAAVRGGKHAVAVREYDLLLKVYPETNPQAAHLALSRAHLALGDKEKAREHASKVLELDADSAEAREILEKAAP